MARNFGKKNNKNVTDNKIAKETDINTSNKDKASAKPTKDKNFQVKMQYKFVELAKQMQRGENEGALLYKKERKGLFINAIGQFLYELGYYVEYQILLLCRAIKAAFFSILKTIQLLFLALLRPLIVFFRGILLDLLSPFVELFKNIGKIKKGRHTPEKLSRKELLNVFLRSLSYLLPICASAILALTVYFTLSTPYSLAATQDGVLLGYIENDTVWDDAARTVESRVNAASEEQSFESTPTFTLASVNQSEVIDSLQLADRIIEESSDQIRQATGIYVNDMLVGVSENRDALQTIIDNNIIPIQEANPDARVNFVNNISLVDGLYYTESITNAAQIESQLELSNHLQVMHTVTQVREEEIPYPEEEQDSELYYSGTQIISQSGRNGLKNVTEDVSYIDGVEVGRVFISEEITQEARTQITLNGIRQSSDSTNSYTGDVVSGSGSFIWPVPAYTQTTTEFGAHRGLDIPAPAGSAILAADTGTVIEAGYHGSWGYYVLIDHGNGMTTRYAHCSRLDVTPGMNVQQGTQVGLVGNTGNSYGNHLHIEFTVNGILVNPRGYIFEP